MIVAAVREEDKPGSVQFFRYPGFEKIAEVQAHARGIEEMRLTVDSKSLFTIGSDGSVCCFYIDDKELKLKKDRDYSEEILIEKRQQDELAQQIKQMTESIEMEKANHQALMDKQQRENNQKIEAISREIEEKK
jgi:hypothetical protein